MVWPGDFPDACPAARFHFDGFNVFAPMRLWQEGLAVRTPASASVAPQCAHDDQQFRRCQREQGEPPSENQDRGVAPLFKAGTQRCEMQLSAKQGGYGEQDAWKQKQPRRLVHVAVDLAVNIPMRRDQGMRRKLLPCPTGKNKRQYGDCEAEAGNCARVHVFLQMKPVARNTQAFSASYFYERYSPVVWLFSLGRGRL
jgi:hypothetical protein